MRISSREALGVGEQRRDDALVGQPVQGHTQGDGVGGRVGAPGTACGDAVPHGAPEDLHDVLAQVGGLGLGDGRVLQRLCGVPGPPEHHPVALGAGGGEAQLGRAHGAQAHHRIRLRAGVGRLQLLPQLLERVLDDGEQGRLTVGDVGVQGGGGHADPAGDRPQGDRPLVARLVQQPRRGGQDVRAQLGALAAAVARPSLAGLGPRCEGASRR